MNKEDWKLIDGWFVETPKHFFHIDALEAFIKPKDGIEICLFFDGGAIGITWEDVDGRDAVFNFLKEAQIAYSKACAASSDRSLAISQSHVALQAKMTEKFLGMDTHV